MSTKKLGKLGEDMAAAYLKGKGYHVKERNFRVRTGEIDIVAYDNEVLVFVEVKTRSGSSHGQPSEAVTLKKQQQVSKAALAYIDKNDLHDRDARFDVVSVKVTEAGMPHVQLLKNAFDLSYE